jgi:hypothetical protein
LGTCEELIEIKEEDLLVWNDHDMRYLVVIGDNHGFGKIEAEDIKREISDALKYWYNMKKNPHMIKFEQMLTEQWIQHLGECKEALEFKKRVEEKLEEYRKNPNDWHFDYDEAGDVLLNLLHPEREKQ